MTVVDVKLYAFGGAKAARGVAEDVAETDCPRDFTLDWAMVPARRASATVRIGGDDARVTTGTALPADDDASRQSTAGEARVFFSRGPLLVAVTAVRVNPSAFPSAAKLTAQGARSPSTWPPTWPARCRPDHRAWSPRLVTAPGRTGPATGPPSP